MMRDAFRDLVESAAPGIVTWVRPRWRAANRATQVWDATHDPRLVSGSLAMDRLSRQAFDWSTTHRPRWWEYPWIAAQVRQRLTFVESRRAADFGAGKSPMPIALARLGLETFVVDPAQLESIHGEKTGNEWDFVHYGRWGIITHQAGMEQQVFDTCELGFAISVSVIEHLEADVRRQGLAEIARALVPGGFAVLTVDVLPGSRSLWNRVVDEVEPLEAHGTVDDLISEAASVGLQLEHFERCPIREQHLEVVGVVFLKG